MKLQACDDGAAARHELMLLFIAARTSTLYHALDTIDKCTHLVLEFQTYLFNRIYTAYTARIIYSLSPGVKSSKRQLLKIFENTKSYPAACIGVKFHLPPRTPPAPADSI